ncbi:MAG TPA: YCF48-related protein [Bryobacteraceae bacterium]
MTPSFARRLGVLALLTAACPAFCAERWKLQYNYDEEKSRLTIHDIQFASPARGVAVGVIIEGSSRGRGHEKPVALVTSDGGEHWDQTPLKETPISLFFLNETSGWLVTENNLWQTTEVGKNWRKLPKPPGPLYRVYFVDEKTGFAAGPRKAAYETSDGGEHWKPIKAASEPPGDKDVSAYTFISFATPQIGLIAGWNHPKRRNFSRFPDWMDPEEALMRRELPHLTYNLATSDGGKTWKAGSASVFGTVTRMRFDPKGGGLGLIQHEASFRYPSEVYKIDWHTGKSTTLYRDPRIAVSDIWMAADGTAYLVGNLLPGKLRSVVPGRVQVLKSKDYTSWVEMNVDYRAVATQAVVAAAGDDLWVATDTGMILKLTR